MQVIPETILGEWRKSTVAVNRFIESTSDFKRVKMGDQHAVRFTFNNRRWLLMDTGDLYVDSIAGKLEYIPPKMHRRKDKNLKMVTFSIQKTYYNKQRKEIILKDLLWAAFGRTDLPRGWEVFAEDGNEGRIQLNNISIRRK